MNKPQLKNSIRFEAVDSEGIFLFSEQQTIFLKNPLFSKLIPLIDGQTDNQSEENIQLQQAISFFAEVNLAENDLETIMQEISHKYQELWGDGDLETDLMENQTEYTKSAKKLVREVTEKYPLPTFSFDDLL